MYPCSKRLEFEEKTGLHFELAGKEHRTRCKPVRVQFPQKALELCYELCSARANEWGGGRIDQQE